MSVFTDNYVDLLIKQYWEKPNAAAEIAAQAATWESIRDILLEFGDVFDLDQAIGDQLDKIGKLVGLPRDRIEFTNDGDYRFYIRVKISQNSGSAYLVSDDRISIQEVIQFAFEGLAYVLDRKDMTLLMYIEDTFDIPLLLTLLSLDILPKPQGVRYLVVMYETTDLPFGFSELTLPDPTDVAGYGELKTDIAFIDNGNDELRTYRWDAGTEIWSLVGTGLAISSTNIPALTALNETDIAFYDSVNKELRTYQWDTGTETWSLVGTGLAIGLTAAPGLAALNETDIAFFNSQNDELRTYRWDPGTETWSLVGTGLVITGASFPALTSLNETDVAFIDSGLQELRTYRWDSGTETWSLVGTGLAIASAGFPALTTLNVIDIAFIDNTNDELRTYRWDTGTETWSLVGTGLAITSVGSPALTTLNPTDVVFIDNSNDELRTYQWHSGTETWSLVGTGLAIASVNFPALATLGIFRPGGGIYSELFEV